MNKILLNGVVNSEKEFSHEVLGEKFYKFYLKTTRISGVKDTIKCVASELYVEDVNVGTNLKIEGEIRTYNNTENEKRKLDVFVFVTEKPEVTENLDSNVTNEGIIEGYVCKKTDCRKTPKGREISELIIAVNRPYSKSDYIPCICWGRNAQRGGLLNVGDSVKLKGRLQSRIYVKKLNEKESVEKVAYEFSTRTIEVIGDKNIG